MKDARTGLEELSEEDCWSHLRETSVGRLAVVIGNKPDVFPVNYLVDDRTLLVQSAPGLKLVAATVGAGVAFEIDALDETTHTGWSVVVRGAASEIESLDELIRVEELGLEPWADGDKRRYIRIQPHVVTGRRVPDPAE